MHARGERILVTGATGQQGGAIAARLLEGDHPIRVMTRHPDGPAGRALADRGAEVVMGDFDDPDSLERALEAVWGAYSVQNTWEAGVEREEEQGKRFAEIARAKGVEHFVYSSVGSAHRGTGIPHFENKWRIEERIRELGFPSTTILRPVFFMENWSSPWFKPGLLEGELRIALAPDTALQMVAVEDIGRFGALAFERHERMTGREIEIAGDARTMPETAEVLSRALGREIRFAPVPIEAVRSGNPDFAAMLEWFDAVGYDGDVPGLEAELGERLKKLPEWASGVDWGAGGN
jgi:uncharacterized protein YbjT (DUF2867 family)